MKRIICLLILTALAGFAQDQTKITGAIGIKPGMNITTYNPDDGEGNLSGIGFNIGFGLGIDVGNIGVELAPSFRSTNYSRTTETILGDVTLSGHYQNFYLPMHFLLKANEIGTTAPFLGLGFALDLQNDGYWALTSGSTTIKTDVPSDELQNDFFLSLALGADVKQNHFKITPELTFDYNLTADDADTDTRTESNYDFTVSVGFYFVP
jgi:hypothetical protein